MVECIKIEIGHQFGLYIIDRLTQGLDEFVEILLVQEYFVPVIPIVVKPFTAFGNCKVIIISAGSSNIKKVGPSFAGTNALAVNTLYFLVIILVHHSS